MSVKVLNESRICKENYIEDKFEVYNIVVDAATNDPNKLVIKCIDCRNGDDNIMQAQMVVDTTTGEFTGDAAATAWCSEMLEECNLSPYSVVDGQYFYAYADEPLGKVTLVKDGMRLKLLNKNESNERPYLAYEFKCTSRKSDFEGNTDVRVDVTWNYFDKSDYAIVHADGTVSSYSPNAAKFVESAIAACGVSVSDFYKQALNADKLYGYLEGGPFGKPTGICRKFKKVESRREGTTSVKVMKEAKTANENQRIHLKASQNRLRKLSENMKEQFQETIDDISFAIDALADADVAKYERHAHNILGDVDDLKSYANRLTELAIHLYRVIKEYEDVDVALLESQGESSKDPTYSEKFGGYVFDVDANKLHSLQRQLFEEFKADEDAVENKYPEVYWMFVDEPEDLEVEDIMTCVLGMKEDRDYTIMDEGQTLIIRSKELFSKVERIATPA